MKIEITLTIVTAFVFCFGTPAPPTDRNEEPWLNHDSSSDSVSGSVSGQSSPQGSQSGSSSGSSSDSSSSSDSGQSSPQGSQSGSSSGSGSASDQSSHEGSISSNSIEILEPIDSSVEELPARPGDFQDVFVRQLGESGSFQDAFLRHLQQPDFLPSPPSGNEIFVENSPETIQIYVEDQPEGQPSTSTGRRYGQGPPTGRPEACLKKKSKEQEPGPSPKKPKTINIADGCEVVYVDTGRESPVDVHLVCTSNTGEQHTLAEYEAVECENDIEEQTTEIPRVFEHNPEDDDDDHDTIQRRVNAAQFNDELTLALLRATQGQFHNCVELIELQNKTQRRQRRFLFFFGPAIALVIAAIAIEHEASKVPQCPHGFIRYGSHCIKEGQSDTCPRGFVDLRFVKKISK